MTEATAFAGARIFDGRVLLDDHAVVVRGGRVEAVTPASERPRDAAQVDLGGGVLAPGFVDLQVNGGGGVMFNEDPTPGALRTIAEAHARLGATSILPTLITDTPEITRAAIDAAEAAIAAGTPGIAGLHLEGPHLSLARKGAHDPALIRAMEPDDLALVRNAAHRLPVLMTTVAPESVTCEQIGELRAAGVIVSLGHSDAGLTTCRAVAEAGATCVTHLFNAMSQLGNREPGLVGAALADGRLSAGLIADGVHVHATTMKLAMAAKQGPGRIFLVSDAMATAGSAITSFELNGRRIERRDGRLTLADGTLAGADLDLATAIRNVVDLGVSAPDALAMATTLPAGVIGAGARIGAIAPGMAADFTHLDDALTLSGVWRAGIRL